MRNAIAISLLLSVLVLARCGIYAEANVTAGGPVYAEQAGGQIIAWGFAVNLGTATARNTTVTLTIVTSETKVPIESHTQFLGDMAPGAKVKFCVVLESVKFGDPIVSQTRFDWD